MNLPSDFHHLCSHARLLFPRSTIAVSYDDDEIIYIDVDETRFAFEIGSDDDEYVFVADGRSFVIPMMNGEECDFDLCSPLPLNTNAPE